MTQADDGIQTVVFDLGGVLLDWNPRHLYRKLFGGRAAEMEQFLTEVCSEEWNLQNDAGRPFADGVAALQAAHPHLAELIAAYHHRWDETLAGALEDTVAILSELRRLGVPLYALTNFSAEKFPIARDRFAFLEWFDGIVVSGEEKAIKPDRAIFDILIGRYGLDPAVPCSSTTSPGTSKRRPRWGSTFINSRAPNPCAGPCKRPGFCRHRHGRSHFTKWCRRLLDSAGAVCLLGRSCRTARPSPMQMPEPDRQVLARRGDLVGALRRAVSPDCVIADEQSLKAFECDGLTAYKQPPMVAVLPETVNQVARTLKLCQDRGVKVVPRGAGTSLSGGALPLADGVLLTMTKFNSILEIDFANRCAVVQPGVTNLAITEAVKDAGFYYAPDPSSQIACTIGGNVAENSGGVHCLKYGLTTNNILGLQVVLMDGTILRLGGKHLDAEGYDLLGLMTGSEGLLGVVTEVTVRLLRAPETARALLIGFPSNEAGGDCVAKIIGAGIIPAGLEMMDRFAIQAAEEFCHPGYPLDAESLLIVELDGPDAEVDDLVSRVREIADGCGALSVKVSETENQRLSFWAGRKAAFPAIGRLSPDYYCMDGTIPRHKLPVVLTRMAEMSRHYGLRVANVFHAGDGNLHPLIMYDANNPGELEKAEEFGAEILTLCVEVGGVLTGEHGVGVEKRDLMPHMFNETDLNQQQRIKCAFDPDGYLNPGKVFPVLHRCAELGRMHISRGQMPFPDLPRF